MSKHVQKALDIINELHVYNDQKLSMGNNYNTTNCFHTVKGIEHLNNGEPMREDDIRKYIFLKHNFESYPELKSIFNTVKALCPTFTYKCNDFTNGDIKREIEHINELYNFFHST